MEAVNGPETAGGGQKRKVSQQKIEANRRNGKKGGPKTAEGKNRSAGNAFKHGGCAKRVVVMGGEAPKDLRAFTQLLDKLKDPSTRWGAVQAQLLEQLAVCVLRSQRIQRAEHGALVRTRLGAEQAAEDESVNLEMESWSPGALQGCTMGLEYLLEGLDALTAEMRRGPLGEESQEWLVMHLPDSRAAAMFEDPPVVGEDFLEALDAEAVRLRALVPKLEAKEAREREANLELAALPAGPYWNMDLFQRYDTSNQRQVGRLLRDLAQAEDRARRLATTEHPRRTKAFLRNEPTGAAGAAAGRVARRRIQKASRTALAPKHKEQNEPELPPQQARG
jgi:hypothetical protein